MKKNLPRKRKKATKKSQAKMGKRKFPPLVLVEASTMTELTYKLNEYRSAGFLIAPDSVSHFHDVFWQSHTAHVFKPNRRKLSKKRKITRTMQTKPIIITQQGTGWGG